MGEPVSEIEWVLVSAGRVTRGSDNRSVLFGGIGPRHQVAIEYEFEISCEPIALVQIEMMSHARLASEAEVLLAHSQDAISGIEGSGEIVADRLAGGYWNQPVDGRPATIRNGSPVEMIWHPTGLETRLTNALDSHTDNNFGRAVRPSEPAGGWSESPQKLPPKDLKHLLIEESILAILIGIIPSFTWAYFNASAEYLKSGWPGLILGGIFLSLFTAIFWRPKRTSYRLGRNCGKVKRV